jgi:transposase
VLLDIRRGLDPLLADPDLQTITGEWIDADTGEVQRTRMAPADRAAVRKFLQRFRRGELEVALEATTGWRFVVEELRRVGTVVHLAEPAETAGLRGPKKRAKGDRATPGICAS